MKSVKLLNIFALAALCVAFSGCCRNSDDVWDDTKTASRHMERGFRSLGGKHGHSRQVQSPDEFMCWDEDPFYAGCGQDFEGFADDPNASTGEMGDFRARQPNQSPGDPGSSIPGISAFKDPQSIPGLGGVFRSISFDYNSNLVKGSGNLDTLHRVADYLRTHPNTYVFIEGHCDQRGAEAYNLALGARRSNAVRNLLVKEGADPDRIFTISYGKERLLVQGDHEEAWSMNRRAEFKVYVR